MRRDTYEVDFTFNNILFVAEYRIYGKYLAATRFEPEEYPQAEIVDFYHNRKKLVNLKPVNDDKLWDAAMLSIAEDMNCRDEFSEYNL